MLIRAGDRIAVALSGGKDSTALLLILSNIIQEFRDVSLIAITVDEGISGYRDDTISAAITLAHRLGIDHRVVSFNEMFDGTLDAFLEGREERACSVCGILRRKALADAARMVGATRIATGHNLNDEAQSVLMNTLRGDLPRLVRESSNETGLFIPRIKPLAEISEKEIGAYLIVRGFWTDLPECPYTRYALRADVRSMLSHLEYTCPGTMKKLMNSRKILQKRCAGSLDLPPLQKCRICGEPSSGDLCQFCSIISLLRT